MENIEDINLLSLTITPTISKGHVKEVVMLFGLGVVGRAVGVNLADVVGVALAESLQPRLVHPPGRVRKEWERRESSEKRRSTSLPDKES